MHAWQGTRMRARVRSPLHAGTMPALPACIRHQRTLSPYIYIFFDNCARSFGAHAEVMSSRQVRATSNPAAPATPPAHFANPKLSRWYCMLVVAPVCGAFAGACRAAGRDVKFCNRAPCARSP
jgi:hypothetical protein